MEVESFHHRSDRHILGTSRHLFAIASDEGNRAARVKQFDDGLDNADGDANIGGHGLGHVWYLDLHEVQLAWLSVSWADAGLSVGNQMAAYRIKPKPSHLRVWHFRIDRVGPKKELSQPTGRQIRLG
jgi:hypothetical protein